MVCCCWSVCYDFLKGWKVTLACSYQSALVSAVCPSLKSRGSGSTEETPPAHCIPPNRKCSNSVRIRYNKDGIIMNFIKNFTVVYRSNYVAGLCKKKEDYVCTIVQYVFKKQYCEKPTISHDINMYTCTNQVKDNRGQTSKYKSYNSVIRNMTATQRGQALR